MNYTFSSDQLGCDIDVQLETRIYGSVDPYLVVTEVLNEKGDNLLRSEVNYVRVIASAILYEAEMNDWWCDQMISEWRADGPAQKADRDRDEAVQ